MTPCGQHNGATWSATRYLLIKAHTTALGKFPKALYGTTEGTCSASDFRPVMVKLGLTLF